MGNVNETKKTKSKTKIDDHEKEDSNVVQIYYSSMNGKKKKQDNTGQDVIDIMTTELGENIKFFSVYDGHGNKGKDAALMMKNEVGKKIKKEKNKINSFVRKEQVETFFRDTFKNVQKKFADSNDYEISGTCSISILVIETKLYCINLGDSRAVLGTKKNGKKCAIEMSIDHKPSRDDEMRRINQMGGEVSEKIMGILRVFKKNDDAPGLAVSRSMGDIMGHECGVISEPEVIERELEPEDAFIIIASDGVWDAMSSTEVVGFIFDKMEQNKEMVANMLVEECRMRWEISNLFKQKYMLESIQSKEASNEPKMKNDETKHLDIDDITAIVHFLTYYE